jgi:peptidoglycan/xylan/chitin deacetylase (PgdA/CDA1 family)
LTTLLPRFRWNGPQALSFATDRKEVWLTIDDGPAPDTDAVLDILEAHGAKATFFVIGERVERRPDWIGKILAAGHGLGNHTYTHPVGSFWMAGPRRIAREIDEASAVLEKAVGSAPPVFRAPAGFRNVFVWPALERRGMTLVGWSRRALDGCRCVPELAVRRLLRNLQPGDLLLMHQGRVESLELLEALLQRLDAAGYRCVLPERVGEERFEALGPGHDYSSEPREPPRARHPLRRLWLKPKRSRDAVWTIGGGARKATRRRK